MHLLVTAQARVVILVQNGATGRQKSSSNAQTGTFESILSLVWVWPPAVQGAVHPTAQGTCENRCQFIFPVVLCPVKNELTPIFPVKNELTPIFPIFCDGRTDHRIPRMIRFRQQTSRVLRSFVSKL
jgi:hypothetical protein